MTAKLYQFPSGEQIKESAMDGGALVILALALFAGAALLIHRYTR